MADNLQRLKKKRALLKASVTKFSTYLDSSDEEVSVVDIKVRLERIEKLLDEFIDIQLDIDVLEDTEGSSEIDNFETAYYNVIKRAKGLISSREPVSNTDSKVKNITPTKLGQQICNVNSEIRLPVLELPTFSGDYKQWFHFRETFEALIASNQNLSDVQRFYYLNACLKGNASQLISSIEVSARNYKVAWDLLISRYEDEKLIVNSHVQSLTFDLPAVVKENYDHLRKLLDELTKHMGALEALGQPVKEWDTLLIYLVTSKLDTNIKKAWESSLNSPGLPRVKDLIEFLNKKCKVLESINSHKEVSPKNRSISNIAFKGLCALCKGTHFIACCQGFLKLNVKERCDKIKELKLCLNCLKGNHIYKTCAAIKCAICYKPHNKLLHFKRPEVDRIEPQSEDSVAIHCRSSGTGVFLSTASINLKGENGQSIVGRAILDAGSDSNFVTKKLADKLNLKNGKRVNISVSGIGCTSSSANFKVDIEIRSRVTSFKQKLSFFVIDRITDRIPLSYVDISEVNIPNGIKLADPEFNIPRGVDILLSAEIFYNLINNGQIALGRGLPTLRDSKLGWLVTGKMDSNTANDRICNFAQIDQQLEKFWTLEECPVEGKRVLTVEEAECERNFVENYSFSPDGRFVVHLPLCKNPQLGESKQNAIKRFEKLERRLIANSEVREMYSDFIQEYEKLGHMEKVSGVDQEDGLVFYIPHQHVLKASSATTRLRVVFDASAKTSNNRSLNDILLVGPVIQSDLFTILLRFRQHNVVIVGDVEKMYRQVLVAEKFQNLQRIVWRDNVNDEVNIYKLKTVTYGTAPASFLATRCLKQIALNNVEKFPNAACAIVKDFYMDDFLSGASSVSEALKLKSEVSNILSERGFHLRKWSSNCDEVLSNSCGKNEITKHFLKDDFEQKTLGIIWEAKADEFKYTMNLKEISDTRITKRSILATIAKLFDPLGLLAPIVVSCKILMQTLWSRKLDWDEDIPEDLKKVWNQLRDDFTKLADLKIPRRVLCDKPLGVQLHGFTDASLKAYGCAIYVRSENESETRVSLWCSKSRVAPLKSQTLPRLELCGAVLLTKLMKVVSSEIDLKVEAIHYWTDSQIVLYWIKNNAHKWKTFVSNRVSIIQGLTNSDQWHHVSGNQNPADIVSRGATVQHLTQSDWFDGPTWLAQGVISLAEPLPQDEIKEEILEARKQIGLISNVSEVNEPWDRFSSLLKIVRVTAWIKRFAFNCKRKETKLIGDLSVREYNDALEHLIKLAQQEMFSRDINHLRKGKGVSIDSKLLPLNPFLDASSLLRVGGRLKNSLLSFKRKHPIILPRGHKLTKLIISYEHTRLLHAGCGMVLASLREKYWPIAGRSTVRNVLSKCITCFRCSPQLCATQMGNLPRTRLEPIRPFHISGVDFAGPLLVKEGTLRGRKLVKTYICLFVCHATKAVHIELVGNLTAEAFLNALKRCIARRGIIKELHSDNGTNFVGAFRELKEIHNNMCKLYNDPDVRNYLMINQVTWKFNPSRSPHMGGLFEAAIKSAKFHLKRIIGNNHLTYEKLSMVLIQIESVLNSRPLFPTSNDPNDLEVLTPGHFLIGSPLTALPAEDVTSIQPMRLKDYLRLQHMVQHFWKRWSSEYLSSLQERSKWSRIGTTNLKIGDLVLLKEDNVPALLWKRGRVSEVHPGTDGIIRVVTIRTNNGSTRRSIHKVALLPLESPIQGPGACSIKTVGRGSGVARSREKASNVEGRGARARTK